MPITIDCPNCAKTLRINESAAGKKVKCPKCQELFRVPAEPVEDDELAAEEEVEERPARHEKTKKSSKSKRKSKGKDGNRSLVLGLGIGGGVLVLLLIGGIIWWATRDKLAGTSSTAPSRDGNPPTDEKPVISMTADEFDRELENHTAAAIQRLVESSIRLTGIVQDAYPYKDQSLIILVRKSSILGLDCTLTDPQAWSQVSIGQEVTIKGSYSVVGLERGAFVDLRPNPVPATTAEQLAADYASNREATFTKYKDKRVILTGTVVAKDEGGFHTLYLKGDGVAQIACDFPADKQSFDLAQVGQQVKILARGYSTDAGNKTRFDLTACYLIK